MSFADIANPGIETLPIYEPGKPITEVARELGFKDAGEVVKLASNENALGPSPKAVKVMTSAAAGMHRYPDGGAFYLGNALASRLGLDPEMLLFGNGSNELIELLGHVYLGPNRNIVMADHAFVVYRLVAAACGASVLTVPMKNLTHDLDAMVKAITPETSLVFISNPNNPTGTMVGQHEIDRFMDAVPDHVVTCFDEAYIELLANDRQPDTLRYVKAGRAVVVLRTFSKTYGLAGLRIGYGIASEEGIRLLNRVRQPFNVNAMAQEAAIAALEDQAHVDATREMVESGLTYLTTELRAHGIDCVPAVVNFMLVEVGEWRAIFESLMREGVIVRPMDGYGLPQYVRVTVGTAEENECFVRALKKVLGKS